jgi:tetratricopeptide (TPR) repeat protein
MAALVSQSGEAGKQIETMLHRMIAEGRMPATGHFALGTKAWKEEESDKALWHLERAYELDPGLGHTGNNLAWMLADHDPPELDRALQIIDSVIEKFPKIATFHDTKGFVLMKMGMWEAALTEFETALPGMRDNIEIHKSLATVYREVQQPELADEHDRIVADLEKAARIKKAIPDGNPFNPDVLKVPTELPKQPQAE